MAINNLENLLMEYEQKRRKAEMELEQRRSKLQQEFPQLEEIENRINELSIKKSKSILNNRKDIEIFNIEIEQLKQKRNKFIEEKNIREKYLKPQYECEICKDTGYIDGENYKKIMCSCLSQRLLNIEYNNSNLSNIKNNNFQNFNLELFSDEVNLEKYKIKCSPKENMKNIKIACERFIKNFDDLNEKNILFIGNTGLGKTYLSNCIANELIKNGKTVLYQTAPVLLETIIDNKFNKYKNQKSDEFYKKILDVDLLIIDDLGTESVNSLTISELFTIINTRILNLNNKSTKTIISTNLSGKQIFKIYEERIGSRIAGYYNIYQFFGDDLRLKIR